MVRKAIMIGMAAIFMLGVWMGCCWGKHSDGFLLGVYSYMSNYGGANLQERETLCREMQVLGYNSTIIQTSEDDPDLSGLLAELDSRSIDAWILDKRWNTDTGTEFSYALHPVSTSNHLRFEAEFANEADVRKGDALDSQYWYAARSDENLTRTGRPVQLAGASYGFVWEADRKRDQAGYAFTDLRYRWPNLNGAYIRFGREMNLYQINPSSLDDDYIWVTYRFRVSNVKPGLDPQDPLLSFSLAGYTLSGSGFSAKDEVIGHKHKDTVIPETFYRVEQYLAQKEDQGFVEMEIKVSYADLIRSGLLTSDTDGDPSTAHSTENLQLINLNPRLYWYGNCDLQLDYVDLSDQIYHELVANPAFWEERIIRRMRAVADMGKGNVSGFYSLDEPRLGQFTTYRLLEDMAQRNGFTVFTANFDYQADNIVLNRKNNVFYDHIDAWMKIARPTIMAPDIYPVTPLVDWNNDSGTKKFIQDEIENKAVRVYRNSREYCSENDERKFWPVVQVFGRWSRIAGQEQWVNWINPPAATQKALLYLPLCFAPDGIIHYKLRSHQTREGYGDSSVLISRPDGKNYPVPTRNVQSWEPLLAVNKRVLEYGRIIRDLKWLEAETVGTSENKAGAWRKSSLITSLKVKPAGIGEYEGYVECAQYLDNSGNPYYMLVNRRGNFFRPGKYTDARFVPETEFSEYFPEAGPQTLTIGLSSKAKRMYGKNLALYDPYDGMIYPCSGSGIDLILPAGEGRLLKLIGILPSKTTGKHKIKGDVILSGDYELKKGSKVVLDKGSHLTLRPGTRLLVDRKSKLYMYGNVTLLGNAQIIVKGKFRNKARVLDIGPDAAIIVMN